MGPATEHSPQTNSQEPFEERSMTALQTELTMSLVEWRGTSRFDLSPKIYPPADSQDDDNGQRDGPLENLASVLIGWLGKTTIAYTIWVSLTNLAIYFLLSFAPAR